MTEWMLALKKKATNGQIKIEDFQILVGRNIQLIFHVHNTGRPIHESPYIEEKCLQNILFLNKK